MKVLSISFWVGIITAVLFFITMLCFAWDDGRMHEKKKKNSIWKYILFLLMGMITSVFCLVFVFAYFTNILEIINGVKIVNIADAQVEGTIFIIWNVFVIAKYYLCILFPTSMNNRQSERINKKQIIFLCVVNTLIELFIIWYYRDVLWYVISWIFC